jgi:dTDP-4-dehydrorhamnose reductase
MRVLITGAAGQLGRELQPLLRDLGTVALVDRVVAPEAEGLTGMDLADLASVEALLDRLQPDVIANAAAYTAVDRAEDEPDAAFRVNGELPGCLGRWAAINDCFVLHYSTDYVFPGDATSPYRESDRTGPLSVYGESKLAGERAVAESGCRHVTLRTSWVYSGHGQNFVLTMLRLARERPELGVVSDQVGCPTWARNLARVSRQVLDHVRTTGENVSGGLYHYCDAGVVSWYDFARIIFNTAAELGLLETVPNVTAIGSDDFPQKAERPAYSVLDTNRLSADFGIERIGLAASLRACLEELNDGKEQQN